MVTNRLVRQHCPAANGMFHVAFASSSCKAGALVGSYFFLCLFFSFFSPGQRNVANKLHCWPARLFQPDCCFVLCVVQVGAISARVLDDLCRHAGVVGVKPFTRSDAVLAAAMKDNLRLYKCASHPSICLEMYMHTGHSQDDQFSGRCVSDRGMHNSWPHTQPRKYLRTHVNNIVNGFARSEDHMQHVRNLLNSFHLETIRPGSLVSRLCTL